MRRFVLAGFAALALSSSSAVLADQAPSGTATPSAVATTPAAPATDATTAAQQQASAKEVVCKRERVTGQLLAAPKVCHTRAEWEALAGASGEHPGADSFQYKNH